MLNSNKLGLNFPCNKKTFSTACLSREIDLLAYVIKRKILKNIAVQGIFVQTKAKRYMLSFKPIKACFRNQNNFKKYRVYYALHFMI